METKHTPGRGAPGEGYERRDANIRSLLQFAFWLFAVLVVVLFGMKWTFSYFAKSQQLGPPASPFESARVLPPKPRLQVEPRADLKGYCEAQQQQLNSYGWVDEHNGVVRIPIDRAMDMIVQRGLPARSSSEGSTAASPAASETTARAPQPMGVQGPCGYLTAQPSEEVKQ